MAPVLPIALLAPLAWFPWRWPPLTVAALLLLPTAWLLQMKWARRPTFGSLSRTAALLIAAFLLSTAAAATPVVDWSRGLPKVIGVALGAGAALCITSLVRSRQSLLVAIFGLGAIQAAVALLGLVATEWATGKFGLLDPLYAWLPLRARGVVPTTSGAIHPNELAGTLLLLFPLQLATAACLRGSGAPRAVLWAAPLSGVVSLMVLVGTASRSGIAGAATALAILGVFGVRRLCAMYRLPLGARVAAWSAYALAISATLAAGGRVTWEWITSPARGAALESFESRVELWGRALPMARDFPLTGIGIGQFDGVVKTLYTPLLLPRGEYIPHAHNLFLEYVVELGVPGALSFFLLLCVCLKGCWRAAHSSDTLLQAAGIGAAAGLFGYLVFGLSDAIAPGARAGVLLWLWIGISLVLGSLSLPGGKRSRTRHPSTRALST